MQEDEKKFKEYLVSAVSNDDIESYEQFADYLEQFYQKNNISTQIPIDYSSIGKLFEVSLQTSSFFYNPSILGQAYDHEVLISNSLSYKESRVTYLIGLIHAILDQDLCIIYDHYYVPSDISSLRIRKCALLMLFPLSNFEEQFDQFDCNYGFSKHRDQWLSYLSDQSMIPEFDLGLIYPTIQEIFSRRIARDFEKSGYDINKVSQKQMKFYL